MDPVRSRLPSVSADAVEQKLRARSAQLKARDAEAAVREAPRAALGYCRACRTVVYAGDSLAMAGVYLLHGHCTLDGTTPARSA